VSETVKRFDIEFYTAPNPEGDFAGMEEFEDGEYVLWLDHQNIVDDLQGALADAETVAEAARQATADKDNAIRAALDNLGVHDAAPLAEVRRILLYGLFNGQCPPCDMGENTECVCPPAPTKPELCECGRVEGWATHDPRTQDYHAFKPAQAYGEGHGKPAVCPECGGSGRFDGMQDDLVSIPAGPCPACNGTGKTEGERP
jgi:hypothetical protein